MSNLTRLEAVSDALDTAISTANSLPDAGGGGGASVETCTVTLNFTGDATGFGGTGAICHFTKVVSGTLQHTSEEIIADSSTYTDVAVGSMMFIEALDILGSILSLTTIGATYIELNVFLIEEAAQITLS